MYLPTNPSFLLAFASTILALPTVSRSTDTTITAADIIKVAPSTATCTSTDECRTADVAAPYIALSYQNFGVSSFGAQAALLALMLYESGDFVYSRNHFPAPGVAGQGTRNMQSPAYNLKYARWFADHCSNCGITTAQVDAAEVAGPAQVLALVNNDMWGFSSAAWFLTTQCDASVMDGLAAKSAAGWQAYMGCIGTAATDDRSEVWEKVIALGAW